MEIREEKSSSSAGWYLLGGLIVGAAAGLLLAPRSGAETREEIEAWRRRSTERARTLIARLGDALPTRIKAGAVLGAVKGGAKQAASSTRDELKQFSGS